MNQCLNTWAELYKGPKWRDARHRTFNRVAGLELLNLVKPWVFSELLHTQAQALFVDSNNLCVNRLAYLDIVRWVIHALPANL